MNEKENTLVEMVLAGKLEAFDPLVTPYRRALLSLAFRLTKNWEDTKEVAQETLLRAFRYLSHFDKKRSFKNWLFQIPVNAARNFQKKSLPLAGKDEARDWPESEWKAVIKNVISQQAEPRESVHKASPRLAWAYGFAVLALLAVVGFLLRSVILKPKGIPVGPEKVIVKRIETPEAVPGQEKPQEPKKQENRIAAPVVTAKSRQSEPSPVQVAKTFGQPDLSKSQDTLSVTLVSKETGLKVTWIFDKNFEWTGEEK